MILKGMPGCGHCRFKHIGKAGDELRPWNLKEISGVGNFPQERSQCAASEMKEYCKYIGLMYSVQVVLKSCSITLQIFLFPEL